MSFRSSRLSYVTLALQEEHPFGVDLFSRKVLPREYRERKSIAILIIIIETNKASSERKLVGFFYVTAALIFPSTILKCPRRRAVSASDFGSRGRGFKSRWRRDSFRI